MKMFDLVYEFSLPTRVHCFGAYTSPSKQGRAWPRSYPYVASRASQKCDSGAKITRWLVCSTCAHLRGPQWRRTLLKVNSVACGFISPVNFRMGLALAIVVATGICSIDLPDHLYTPTESRG